MCAREFAEGQTWEGPCGRGRHPPASKEAGGLKHLNSDSWCQPSSVVVDSGVTEMGANVAGAPGVKDHTHHSFPVAGSR